jgi:hypothetical protein
MKNKPVILWNVMSFSQTVVDVSEVDAASIYEGSIFLRIIGKLLGLLGSWNLSII